MERTDNAVITMASAPLLTSTLGAWGATIQAPIIPIAAAVLPDGHVLMWSSDDVLTFETDIGAAPSTTLTAFVDPSTGNVSSVVNSGVAADMFCPGIAYLPDGRLLVNGGSSSSHTALFDPFSGTNGS